MRQIIIALFLLFVMNINLTPQPYNKDYPVDEVGPNKYQVRKRVDVYLPQSVKDLNPSRSYQNNIKKLPDSALKQVGGCAIY